MAEEKRMKPKGKRGLIAVKRLGRTYKTGGFERIKEKCKIFYARKLGTTPEAQEERCRKVAANVYWKMVRKRGG